MSNKHSVQIQRDEHDESINAKKVSLVSAATIYAVTSGGGGSTTVFQGGAPWDVAVKGNITLSDSKAFVGLVSVSGFSNPMPITLNGENVTPEGTNITHSDGENNQRYGVHIDGNKVFQPVYPYVFNGTTWDRLRGNTIGANVNVKGNVTLSDPKGFIGLVTAVGDFSTSFSGNVTVEQVGVVKDIEDGAGDSIMDADNDAMRVNVVAGGAGVATVFQGGSWAITGNVTVEQGDNPWVTSNVGNITVEQGDDPWNVAVKGNVTLSDAKTYIGLTTTTLGVGLSNIGFATVAVSTPTLFAVVNTAAAGQASVVLDNSVAKIGFVTVALGFAQDEIENINSNTGLIVSNTASIDDFLAAFSSSVGASDELRTRIIGNVTLSDSKNYIGLVTATPVGLVTVIQGTSPWASNVIGNITLSDSKSYIGLVTATPVGLVTVIQGTSPWLSSIAGNVTLSDSKTYIGLVTTTYAPPPISTYTSFMSIYSATGNHTIFQPPAGKRWVAKDIHISSLGRSNVAVKSGAGYVIPFTSFATQGGMAPHYGEAGLAADAADLAFVVELNGAATISVMANVRFE